MLQGLCPEVQQQSEPLLGEREVVQDLRFVGGREGRHGFDFDDDVSEADEIDLVEAAERAFLVQDLAGHLQRTLPVTVLFDVGVLAVDLVMRTTFGT